MKKIISVLFFSILAAFSLNVSAESAPAHQLNSFEKVMVDKVWETTDALDQNKAQIDPSDKRVANFFGLAEYYPDGTFKITTFEGKPKIKGDWSFTKDGKFRSLTAKNDDGKVLFTRVVENVTVSPEEYTYRIYPEKENKAIFFDIVHKVKK